ncbi:MAG: mismatch repair protein [Flaviaesturariibacter sp.]|nr:mismatch repair protein [Flaviaesturariibacter sp.]
MSEHNKRQQQAKVLRIARKLHRTTGALLFVFFFIIAITGLLLGWKKHSGGTLLAPTFQGTSSDLKQWLPVDSLHTLANRLLLDSIAPSLSTGVDRIDIRKDKGVVKFVYKDHYWALQLDGVTGKLLHKERRRADFIEHIHDGSLLDSLAGTSDGQIKLAYTTIMGLALLLFTVTGFWLWYGPKRMRRTKCTL